MPSKLRKAIAAVKDQTSISLAKVGGAESSSLEVAVLRATTHDEVPIDERHVTEILQLVSSNRTYAGSCARAIGRRIGRTRSWVVAIKSLMLVLRIFQDGDPHFPKEVLHAMKRGYKILNLSSFRDDSSTSCPWDFTAFVRTFSLYLDERLDCFVTGKLQRRTSYAPPSSTPSRSPSSYGSRTRKEPVVRDMKPAVLLDRISHWQKLLDRAVATRPTGAAKTNRLVHTSLYSIVQETFDLYRDISDGLALLLDSFFHLQYTNCVNAFQTCVRASKQFEELNSFYEICKTIDVGRTSEYPSVQKVSQELIETLQEFLKDQSSFPGSNGGRSPSLPPLPNLHSPRGSDYGSVRRSGFSERERTVSEFDGSQCTSLEDLISADSGFSPERYLDIVGDKTPAPQLEDYYSANDTASVRSDSTDIRALNAVLDLLSSPPKDLLDQAQNLNSEPNKMSFESNNDESSKGVEAWELVLFEPSPQNTTETNDHNHDNVANTSNNSNNGGFELDWFSSFDAPTANVDATANNSTVSPALTWPGSSDYSYNPFLQDNDDFFGGFDQNQASVSSSSNHDFSSSGFRGEVGAQTDQVQFRNMNNGSNFGEFAPNGFSSEFGMVHKNGNSEQNPPFLAGFDNYNGNSFSGFSPQSFSSGAGVGNNNAYVDQMPTIQPEFGSDNGYSYNGFPPRSFSSGIRDGNDNIYGEFGKESSTNFEGYSHHGFSTYLGMSNCNRNTGGQTPTYQAEFGNNGSTFGGFSSHGFSTDMGVSNNNEIVSRDPTSPADFCPSNDHFSADFAPTFHAEYGNGNVIGNGNVNNTDKADDLVDLFSSLSFKSYQGDFGHTRTPPTCTSNHNRRASLPALGHTNFGKGDFSASSTPSADDYGISRTSFTPMSPARSSTEVASPSFADNYMTMGNEFNAMSAIVPYDQPTRNDHELFSSVPSFQATPTFRASSDMDHSFGVHYGNELFGSSSNSGQEMGGSLDQQSVLHQQELWLQNQRKIMSRHWR